MAEFENSTRTPVIKIGTTEAVKNVKDLRDNIKGLRDEIVALSNAEDQNEETTKAIASAEARLIQSQNELNRVMGLTKKGADGVEGSYNRLKAELREVKQEMDALPRLIKGQLNPEWDALAERYRKLNDEAKAYDYSLGNFQRNVGNYGNAWSSLGKSMGEVKQVGGDMQAGIAAMSGVLNIAGIATDGLDDGMNNLRLTLGLVQGAKGLAGMIKSLVKFVAGQKSATAATTADTAAQQAEAAALTKTAAAETAAATAGTVLRTVLMTLGIGIIIAAVGALVAHFEDLVQWLTKVGEKLGIVSKETEIYKDANEKLNEKFDEQKELLDDQQKILKAQGVSNKELLLAKKKLIESQIAETEATINNIKARQAQMKADSAWVRFWKGENRKIKQAQEEIDALTESLKALQKENKDIDIDIRVDEITEGRNAAAKAANKAKEEAEKALKALNDVFTAGLQAADQAIKANETEFNKLQREYNELTKKMNDAIETTKKLTGVTEQQKNLLTSGLQNAAENYTKAMRDYFKKEYEKKVAEQMQKIQKTYTQIYEEDENYEKMMKNVLNLDSFRAKQLGKATAEQQRQYDILKSTVDMLRNDIELPDITPYKSMTDEEIRKEVGEPLATALKMYFEKSKELEDAGIEMSATIFEAYENAFNEQLDSGNFSSAAKIARAFGNQFYEEFKGMGLGQEMLDYFTNTFDKVLAQAELDDAMPNGFSVVDILFPQSEMDRLEFNISKVKMEMQSLIIQGKQDTTEFYDYQSELDALEEALFKKKIERFSAVMKTVQKYYDVYVKTSTNAIDNVADAWTEWINYKYKQQVKSGKKTEEQAAAEAEAAFNQVKNLQYLTAVISTAGAVVQALADTTVPSWYVKAANAAAALAAGTAQVLKIANTSWSGGAGGGSTSAPKLTDRTPQLQYTYGINPADYAQAAAQTPIKAYVVDKDLAEGLDNYEARENETTF